MEARLDYMKPAPGAIHAMLGLEKYLSQCGLEKNLLNLIKLRASQINGCAFCIDMHTDELIADGEVPARIHLLSVWRETNLFNEREQAGLALAEAVTRISEHGVPDDVYAAAQKKFSETELVNLTLAIAAINSWNRFSITFHVPPALKSLKRTDG